MVRHITEKYAVSPQITQAAMAQLAEMGFTDVICNRPDEENGPDEQHDVMQKAADAAGLKFHFLPITPTTVLERAHAERQKAVIDGAEGQVFAYCASGNRSSVVWALGQAGHMPASDIINAAAEAGYDLSQLRPMLDI